jgi:uncharacterized Zn finger protein (UPF0148 family)
MRCPKCGSGCFEGLRDGYLICCQCNYLFSEEEAKEAMQNVSHA